MAGRVLKPAEPGKPAALIAAAGLALCSCAPTDGADRNARWIGTGTVVTAKARACAAAQYRSELVGRPIEEIDTAVLPTPLRVYAVGSRITMDYRPGRLNIVVGADRRVAALKCG